MKAPVEKPSAWDEYRVSLFKKKLREVLPDLPDIRFYRSKGRCHLVLDIQWRYVNSEEVGAYVMSQLRANGIEAEENRDIYGLCEIFGSKPLLHSVSIPIDQAALPERKRA